MYAIVDIAGQQFRIEKGQEVLVHRLEGEKGSKVDFDKVLLIEHEGKTIVGTPFVEGAQVQATIIDHLKGDKVLVFKKKKRKGYQKLNGHRQYLSLLMVEEILESGAKPKKESKAKEVKAEVPEVKKEVVAKVTAVAEKPKPVKKTTRKPATEKAAVKTKKTTKTTKAVKAAPATKEATVKTKKTAKTTKAAKPSPKKDAKA